MSSSTRRRAWMAAALTAMLATSAVSGLASPADIAAPAIEMKDLKGQRVRLSDFKGKVVLIEVWASWCVDCRQAFPSLVAFHREYQSRGVEVLAVSVDERRKDAEAFLKIYPNQLQVIFDPRARVLEAFDAPGVPSSFVIDRRGMIRYTHEGYGPSTDAAYRREIAVLLAEPPQSN